MTDSEYDESSVVSFFTDPDASDAIVLAANHVAAPVVKGVTMDQNELQMGGGVRIVYFIIDGSPSMISVANELREQFSKHYVPAVKKGRESDISVLRIGGCVFSYGPPQPIWRGTDPDTGKEAYFHSLDSLPPLTKREYDPEKGDGTALYRAIITGTATAMRYAAQVEAETAISPQIDVIVLTDGGDNEYGRDRVEASEVKNMIMGANRSRVRFVYFYFQNDDWGGAPNAREDAIRNLGFDAEQVEQFLRKDGEDDDALQKRFRRLMLVMSKVSATRGTSAVVAVQNVLDDDEIV